MKKFIINAAFFTVGALALLFLLFMLCLPITYLDGSAKSAYIKQAQGLTVPWYRATFLQVNAGGVSASVNIDE